MRKKLATKVLLTLACLCLLAGVVYAKPAECWYTADRSYSYYTICNLCYILYGNAPNPDAHVRDVYYKYMCPNGSSGWDYMYTEVLDCYYNTFCDHM